MAKRTIGKPRFYADVLQYLKALGYYDHELTTAPDLLNMNPSQPTEVSGNQYFYLKNVSEEVNQLLTNLGSLSSSGIYAGILGHNNPPSGYFGLNLHSGADVILTHEEIVNFYYEGNGFSSSQYQGYSLSKVTAIGEVGLLSDYRISFVPLTTMYVGAITYGRWFEPQYNFDLKATTTTSYDGIKLQKTITGSTYSNINHLGVPMWGDLPAWTLEKQDGHDYKIGGTDGRRSWKVSLSFMTDDNLFHKAGNENQFFTYDDNSGGYTFDESMSSFFKLSLNGKLPFIFCPDSSATDLEFALCKIDKDPSFKQVANNLFSTSLSITEVF